VGGLQVFFRMNSGFRRGVYETFALVRCYAEWIGTWLPKDNISIPSSTVTLEDGTDRFSRNVGK
jgi:hypothetical protein